MVIHLGEAYVLIRKPAQTLQRLVYRQRALLEGLQQLPQLTLVRGGPPS
jgi:hypothetical protein